MLWVVDPIAKYIGAFLFRAYRFKHFCQAMPVKNIITQNEVGRSAIKKGFRQWKCLRQAFELLLHNIVEAHSPGRPIAKHALELL